MPDFQNEHCCDEIANAFNGGRDALIELLESYRPELLHYAKAMIRNTTDPQFNEDDIVQETFVRAFREINTLRNRSRGGFLAWLKIIAANQIRDAARRKNTARRGGGHNGVRSNDECVVDLFHEISTAIPNTPSRSAAREEAIEAVRIALSSLPADQSEAVRLHYFDRLTVKETARQMSRSTDSVRGLIQRAKQQLRASLHKSSLWLSKKS